MNNWLRQLSRWNCTDRLINIWLVSRTLWLLHVNAVQQPLLISFLLHHVSSCWSLNTALFFQSLFISKVKVALELVKTGRLQNRKAFSALLIWSLWRQSANLNGCGILVTLSTTLYYEHIMVLFDLFIIIF